MFMIPKLLLVKMDKNSNVSVVQTASEVPKERPSKKRGLYPVISGVSVDGLSSFSENIPPGLGRLASMDKLLITQRIRSPNFFIKFQMKNRYRLETPSGRDVYYASEKNRWCTTCCLGRKRPFELSIHDGRGTEFVKLVRPARCQGWCFPCCRQEIHVLIPSMKGEVGSVVEAWKCCTSKLLVKNALGDVVYQIRSPSCKYSLCCQDVVFPIVSKDGVEVVGNITKTWKGCCQEVCTDADNFEIDFPRNINVQMKAVLLAACILVDFMYFEKSKCPGRRFLPLRGFPFA